MHTVEHVGLGRCRDKIDPDGDMQAAHELARVVRSGGSFAIRCSSWSASNTMDTHRIYSYEMVMDMFGGLKLKEFSLIPDNALETGIIINADPARKSPSSLMLVDVSGL